jgi:hypothetical protein
MDTELTEDEFQLLQQIKNIEHRGLPCMREMVLAAQPLINRGLAKASRPTLETGLCSLEHY